MCFKWRLKVRRDCRGWQTISKRFELGIIYDNFDKCQICKGWNLEHQQKLQIGRKSPNGLKFGKEKYIQMIRASKVYLFGQV